MKSLRALAFPLVAGLAFAIVSCGTDDPTDPGQEVTVSVSPTSGPTTGGTLVTVTLSGADMPSSATVSFDAIPAAGVEILSASSARVTTPAHAAGMSDVTVTAGGETYTRLDAFEFIAPDPTVSSVNPRSGPAAGGTSVSVFGSDFVTGATVTFGGAAATGVTVTSAGSITATTPAGTSGVVDVQVTNPDGKSGSATAAFTYVPPSPTISSVTPNQGPGAGGTVVTIQGSNFETGATVSFGPIAASDVTVGSATSITATTPAGSGTVNVTVSNPGGAAATLNSAFTYEPAPTVTDIDPSTGPVGGGTEVTLFGLGFQEGATVTFGGVSASSASDGGTVPSGIPAAAIVVVSSRLITATTPPGSAGAVDVTVTNPDGQGSTLPSGFSYKSAPTITSVAPATGDKSGGTTVEISGTNFEPGSTVTVGGAAASSTSVVSGVLINIVTPPGTGVSDVVVTNPDGQSATAANAFTYSNPGSPAAPTAVTPNVGPLAGGTVTTISGADFEAGATVTFGGTAATGVVVNSATSISATSPAGSAGAVDVVVTNPIGGPGTVTGGFTYMPPASVTSVTPNSGSLAGGTATAIAGSNFEAGATVTFGGTAATGVVVNSATSISATSPAASAGAVDVVVTNPIGGPGTGAGAFTYLPSASITSVTPNAGPLVGGTATTIVGSDFEAGATVTFGGIAATGVVVNSATSISATSPAGSAGAVDVVVTNPVGGPGTALNGFTYMPPPSITSVTPTGGLTTGGTATAIVGSNFESGATVTFGGGAATGVVVNSATSISATTPAGSLGAVDVVVTNPIGGPGTAANAYTYVVMPAITTTSPMPNGTLGSPYSQTLAASGGDGSYVWAMFNSTILPAGFSLNTATGEISGTPTLAATTNFEVQVTSVGLSVDKPLAITIDPAPVIQTSTLLPVIVNLPYAGETLKATGGDGTYVWGVGTGALPAGMTLNATTGVISGTPTALGTANFTIEATSAGKTGSKPLSIDVNPMNEPAGFSAAVERPFNTKAANSGDRGSGTFPNKTGGSEGWDGVESNFPNFTIAAAPGDPLSVGGSMRITYPLGHPAATGPGVAQSQALTLGGGGPYNDLYIRTSILLGPTYHTDGISNKLYFHRMTGSPRSEPFLAVFGNGDGTFNLNANFQGTPDNGLGFFKGTGVALTLRRETFYVFETLLLVNSAQGVKDGVFRLWVNGELVLERTDVEYIRADNLGDEWGSMHVSPTYGGGGGTPTNPLEFYFELGHAYVSGR